MENALSGEVAEISTRPRCRPMESKWPRGSLQDRGDRVQHLKLFPHARLRAARQFPPARGNRAVPRRAFADA